MAAQLIPAVVGADRTPAATGALQTQRRKTSLTGAPLPCRSSVCPPQWHSLGDVAERTGLWLRHDLLAPLARLAARRSLGADPFCPAGLVDSPGRNRLVAAVLDACSVRAVFGGLQTGPNPTDRAKLGSKRHLICDGQGIPLAIRLTGANRQLPGGFGFSGFHPALAGSSRQTSLSP